jgi:hypothetical protein
MEILNLIIAFALGLIPFVIKLIIDLRTQRESLKEVYRVKFYERQLTIFNDIFVLITSVNRGSYWSTLSYKFDGTERDRHFAKLHQTLAQNVMELGELVEKNELYIPTRILEALNNFYENSILLLNPAVTTETAEFRGATTLRNRKELNDFFQKNNNLSNAIIHSFRALVGVDNISNEINKKINNGNKKVAYIQKQYKFELEPYKKT